MNACKMLTQQTG